MAINIEQGVMNPPAISSALEGLRRRFESIPQQHLDFLAMHNGCDCLTREHSVVMWEAENIEEYNEQYRVRDFAPGVVLVGSDGAGEGYCYDLESPSSGLFMIPFVGMSRDELIPVATSIWELFERHE